MKYLIIVDDQLDTDIRSVHPDPLAYFTQLITDAGANVRFSASIAQAPKPIAIKPSDVTISIAP